MPRNRFCEDATEIPGSSTVEPLPVKEKVGGSSPSRGAIEAEYRYPEWALPIQKANCLLELLHDLCPAACHQVLGEALDQQNLVQFKAELGKIWELGLALLLVREAMPYCENPELVANMEKCLGPAGLETAEAREAFRHLAGVMVQARKQQCAGLYKGFLAGERALH